MFDDVASNIHQSLRGGDHSGGVRAAASRRQHLAHGRPWQIGRRVIKRNLNPFFLLNVLLRRCEDEHYLSDTLPAMSSNAF